MYNLAMSPDSPTPGGSDRFDRLSQPQPSLKEVTPLQREALEEFLEANQPVARRPELQSRFEEAASDMR